MKLGYFICSVVLLCSVACSASFAHGVSCNDGLAAPFARPSIVDVQEFLKAIEKKKVVVIGDFMVDRSRIGRASRLSPEAPVPVIDVDEVKVALGGAGNVCQNLKTLGLDVTAMGILGYDPAGAELRTQIDRSRIKAEFLLDIDRATLLKERLVANGVAQARADSGSIKDLTSAQEEEMMKRLSRLRPDVIVLSDYGKGVLTASFTPRVIAWATANKIPVIVDPKGKDYKKYSGATIVKPNRSEAQDALGRSNSIDEASLRELSSKYLIATPLITLSEKGMIWLNEKNEFRSAPTTQLEIFDVTGAGDTVTSILAAGLAGKVKLDQSAPISNLAAGVAVTHQGTYAVTAKDLLAAAAAPEVKRVVSRDEIKKIVEAYRGIGKRIVFTNGVFDLIHAGHVMHLREAKSLGDILIVAINSDRSATLVKEERPVNSEIDRADVMLGLPADFVVMMDEETPDDLLKIIRPDILIKGGDYQIEEVAGREFVESYGGKVIIGSHVTGRSTRSTIEAIRAGAK